MISFCIITKNEEENLKRCISSIMKLCPDDEIVVADTGSTDGTVTMATELGAKVFNFEWIDDFSAARNFVAEKAGGEIIVMLDSDEELTSIDRESLIQIFHKNSDTVGRIEIHNLINSGDENTAGVEWISRVYSPAGYHYTGKVHEQIACIGSDRSPDDKNVIDISIKANHYGYALSPEEKSKKADRNIVLLLKELNEEKAEDKKPYIYYQLGKSFYFKGDYEKASEHFSKALEYDLDPRLEYVIDCVVSYGYALLNSGRVEEAMMLTGGYDTFKGDADFLFVLGLVLMNNAAFDDAVSVFEQATHINNAKVDGVNSYKALYNIGVILECRGMADEALSYYKKCGDYEKAKQRLEALKPT